MRHLLAAIVAALAFSASAQADPLTFVLAGQSNMVGLAYPVPVAAPDANVTVLQPDGSWQPAVDPLYPGGGVGPSLAFGDAISTATGRQVRLIPCASAGTRIAEWLPGYGQTTPSDPPAYDPCVASVQSLHTQIDGVLFYQGETDATLPEWADIWASQFAGFVAYIRRDLGAAIPVVFAQLGSADGQGHSAPNLTGLGSWSTVMAQQASVVIPGVSMIRTSDLLSGPDHVHLTVPSYKTVGERFAAAWLAMPPLQPEPSRPTPSVPSAPASGAATPTSQQIVPATPPVPTAVASPPVFVQAAAVFSRPVVRNTVNVKKSPPPKRSTQRHERRVIGHQGLRVFLAGEERG